MVVYGILSYGAGHDLAVRNYFGVFGDGTRLAMPKTICASDSTSLKPSSGATEGVLDKGVSGQLDYWIMKIQDSRLRPVSV